MKFQLISSKNYVIEIKSINISVYKRCELFNVKSNVLEIKFVKLYNNTIQIGNYNLRHTEYRLFRNMYVHIKKIEVFKITF